MKQITEKYQNALKCEKSKLSRFLKRRRLELGKTLEEVSEGVCSTSYLSKIENCLVDVDESYFQMLFEKLNLEYKAVVEDRQTPIYDELIKAYLNNNVEYIKVRTNAIMETNNYNDAEIEIILILYNLVNGSLDEASRGLEKLEVIKNTLSSEELMVLGFLKVLSYFKNFMYDKISEMIEIMVKSYSDEEILYVAFIDLLLDYYFWTNQKAKFIACYEENKNNKYIVTIKNISIKHYLQKLIVLSLDDDNQSLNIDEDFSIIKDSLNLEMHDLYNYYYSIYLTRYQKFEKAYLILQSQTKTPWVVSLMAYVVDKMNNMNYSMMFLKDLEEYDSLEENPYNDYIEFVRLKLEQYSYNHLYSYLKNKVLINQKVFLNFFLNYIEKIEYYNLAFELGKYKEIARSVLNK